MKYYERLKELREDNDLTQEEVAKLINCSQTAYSKYEKGQRELSLENLVKLSKYYNVSTDYILCITNDKKSSWIKNNTISISQKGKNNKVENINIK